MIRTILLTATAAIGLTATAAQAQDCVIEGDHWDLDEAGVAALYDCIGDRMVEGYSKEGNDIAAAYRDWAVTATRPAVAGAHGERFLLTFANDIAADTYLAFAAEGVDVPVGGILAKESIKIGKEGKARVGPLFIMEKVGMDAAPETGGWFYSGVQPNGKPLRIKQSFCHDCHVGWEAQDMLAYPLEEVRISAN